MTITNRFGSGELYCMQNIIDEMSKSGGAVIYCESSACMSVTSDMLSWISAQNLSNDLPLFVSSNEVGNNNFIIVLGCQVTDLAILNDIKTVERLHEANLEASVYLGGCLAYRFDIELPSYVKRLQATRSQNTEIKSEAHRLMHWQTPFWIKNDSWNETDDEFEDGHIFRDMYPLKIGAGCHGKCQYCTIRDTRGESYVTDAFLQVKEFLDHDNVVLISDSPTVNQIGDWARLAKRYNKPISLRNVEPIVAMQCKEELLNLAGLNLLRIFHCPIQSNDPELLKVKGRDVKSTMEYIELAQQLREYGTRVATNIIIDYTVSAGGTTKTYRNMDVDWLNSHFDYWVWNPYFDGKWDRNKAEQRFGHYINGADKCLAQDNSMFFGGMNNGTETTDKQQHSANAE